MRDPFRKTPWIGRFLLVAIGKMFAIIMAIILSDVSVPDGVAQGVLFSATSMTILALIFMGRVGEMVPGRPRVFLMIAITHIFILISRLLPRLWQSRFLSVDVMSVTGMLLLGLVQIPNIVRAIEMKNAEEEAYRQNRKNNPSNFHRSYTNDI